MTKQVGILFSCIILILASFASISCGNTQMSTSEKIIDIAARALAKMERPDFSKYTGGDVMTAFLSSFTDPNSSLRFVLNENFKAKISTYSNGEVELLEPDPKSDHFSTGVETTQAGYYVLKNKVSGQKKLIIINVSDTPIIFEENHQ